MNRRMMIVAFAALLAVTAAAVVVGSASADSDATVYGTDVQPYACIDGTYEELEDGATYYIVKGGSVSISFAGVDASGMETDLAGSGLITDYVDDRIYGTLEKSATVTIGDKTIRLEASEGTPIYGADLGTYDQGPMSNDLYIHVPGSTSITLSTKVGNYNMGAPSAPDVSAYGLTSTITTTGTYGQPFTLTVSGTPTAGVEDLEIKLTLRQGGMTSRTATYIVHLKIVDTFTLVYDGNDGTPGRTGDTVKYGSSVTLPGATQDDYHITGWYSQRGGGNDYGMPGDSFNPLAWGKSVNETVYLYAQWEMDKTPVIEVEISGASSVQVGVTARLNATTTPADADNGKVTFYPWSGTSYGEIIGQSSNDHGGTCTIKGLAAGTFVVRAIADDGSGKYRDWPITITAAPVESYTFTLT